jgi:hypothetical protein
MKKDLPIICRQAEQAMPSIFPIPIGSVFGSNSNGPDAISLYGSVRL